MICISCISENRLQGELHYRRARIYVYIIYTYMWTLWRERWHFQTPAGNRSRCIKSSRGEEEGKRERRKGEDRRGQVWFPLSFLYRPLRRSRGRKAEEKKRAEKGSSRSAPVCVQSESQINRPVQTEAIREQRCVLSLKKNGIRACERSFDFISCSVASSKVAFFVSPTLKCTCPGYHIRLCIKLHDDGYHT